MVFKRTQWTKEEEQYIIDNFGKMTYGEMGENLGKTLAQVNSKIQHLRKRSLIPATDNQDIKLKVEKEVKGKGLDLTRVKLEVGKKYEVFTPKRENEKLDSYFSGVLIQDEQRHITLRHDLGYCESFLKVDILMGIHQIREGDI